MRQTALTALAVATLASLALQAATTTTVVDIPAATGGIQRYLHIRPDAPVATLVQLPGGDGVLGIQADGSMNTQTGQCNPVARSRDTFTAAGIAIVMVDATSIGVLRDYNDVLRVVENVRARDAVPVWVIGGSSSTAAIGMLAGTLPGDVGAVFYSPQRPSSFAATIRRPSLVVYHSGDSGQFGNSMYNALTSAVVRERSVISSGTDQGCGFHLFNGAEEQFAGIVASFVGRNNAATRGTTRNYQGLWWNSPAGSESGWGVNLTHQGDKLFATWFTYDLDGRGMWLVMPDGRASGVDETYSGRLYRTTGPAFSATPFDPSQVGITDVGSASFHFTGGSEGSFNYVVNGAAQAKAITRQVFATEPECSAGGTHGASPNYSALWWGAPAGAESGWGLNVAHQGDVLFATWFTYDTDGRGLWLVMPEGRRTAAGTYSGALYRTTGPAFNARPWSASGVGASESGQASLVFTSAESGTFSYSVGGVSRSKPIVRQVFATPATVCR